MKITVPVETAVTAAIDTYGLDAVNGAIRAFVRNANDVIRNDVRKSLETYGHDPDGTAPVVAVFSAYNYENGWFLDSDQFEVTFADGDTDTVEVPSGLTDALNDALNTGGACGPESALLVSLTGWGIDYADYQAETDATVSRWVTAYQPGGEAA